MMGWWVVGACESIICQRWRGQASQTLEPAFRAWVRQNLEAAGEDQEAVAKAKRSVLATLRQGRGAMKADTATFPDEVDAVKVFRARVKLFEMWGKGFFST